MTRPPRLPESPGTTGTARSDSIGSPLLMMATAVIDFGIVRERGADVNNW